MSRFPLSRYALDQHVDAGLTNLSGTVDAIPHALAAMIWSLDRHSAGWVIGLFDSAFSINLITADSPVSGVALRASRALYSQLALPLMNTALIIAGIWAIWQMLVMRRYAHGAGRIGLSIAYAVIAIAIMTAPAQTIGVAAQASHELANATLSAALPGRGKGAARDATEGLRASLIHEPWILLNFGASTHCINAAGDQAEPAGYRSNGTAAPPPGGKCLNTRTLANSFLQHEPDSDERNETFNKLQEEDELTRAAVKIQTGAAGYDRIAIAFGLAVAAAGALILIGGLSLGMIAAQLYALLLLACAPAALLASLVPGHGHRIFEVWARQLIGAVFRGAVYCLYLSIAVALSISLQRSAPQIGSIGALTMQAILWWGLVIYGRTLSSRLAERAVASPIAGAATHTTRRIIQALPVPNRASRHSEVSA